MNKNRIIGFFKKGKTPWLVLSVILGGAGGFLYWRFIGCNTGSCPIRSVWYFSTLYGLILGYLLGDIITGFFFKRRKSASSDQ